MLDVNHHRPLWHAYVRGRQQRRQDHIAAVAALAADGALTPAGRVIAGDRARVAAQAAFDAGEPELSYDEFVEREVVA